MTSDAGISREKALFDLCLEHAESAWDDVLAENCNDAELRKRVRRLLDRHRDTYAAESGFLRLEAADPERIGPYRILQRLGEGGMGIVYAAEQREPVRRRVAIKVLRHGQNSREVLARFDIERQALALMNHPNIARIIDAGTTADHRPFIVMEFVSGEPVTRYCERRDLPLRDRLELFCEACEAIQHAHQRGVIHRDIKPSNMLVMEIDGQAMVKVIDFGIAKAVSQPLTDLTMETKAGSLLGTPDYMSPEQAELSPLDLDTRTDVYGLGAVLYELLTGAPPLQLSGSGRTYTDMQRVIRERTPAPPSRRVGGALQRRLRGELDWITLKALEKGRAQRYDSPADLARDIRNHLARRTVIAGPPSKWRVIDKFVRRHWLATASVIAVISTLAVSQVQLVQKNIELQQERDRAALAAQNAEQVTALLAEIFNAVDPDKRAGTELSVGSLLRQGRQRISDEPDLPPAVRSRLLGVIGGAFLNQGYYQDAASALHESLQSIPPRGEAQTVAATIETYTRLAGALQESGDLSAAREILQEARQIVKDFQLEGTDAETSVINALGLHHLFRGEYEQAIERLELVLDRYTAQKGGLHERTLSTQFNLALAYQDMGDATRARQLLEETEASARRAFGPRHSLIGDAAMILGNLARHDGDMEAARAHYKTAVDSLSYLHGKDSGAALMARMGLAMSYRGNPQGTSLLLEVYRDSERLLGRESITTLMAAANLADFLSDGDDYERAFPIAQHAYSGFSTMLGPEHPNTREVAFLFAAIAANAGHREQALQALPIALRSDKWREKIETDRRFDSLRESAEFNSLLRPQ